MEINNEEQLQLSVRRKKPTRIKDSISESKQRITRKIK